MYGKEEFIMKKRCIRICSILLTMSVLITSPAMVYAASADGTAVDATTAAETPASNDKALGEEAPVSAEVAPPSSDSGNTDAGTTGGTAETPQNPGNADNSSTGSNENKTETPPTTPDTSGSDKKEPEVPSTEKKDVSGKVTVDEGDVSGKVTVETDENDDNVTIKKHDKPYLALGADLTPEQQATVLSLMGISQDQLGNYDVVYVNNTEEHQYLDSYIEKSKIGSKSLSSVMIVERGDKNGINISTSNISYCTVGMYKNALATAGIQNADIIVTGPFAISGTAALVGIFKAYKEMTGEEIKEENIDAALNELVVTGALESSTGASADEVEGMIAFVKQQVVKHDMTDEASIREAIEEGCQEFSITLTEDEKAQIVSLMLKIGSLDLDLDSLLNAAQSIYDRISGGEGSGFFAKFTDFFSSIWDKIKGIFQ